MYGKSLPPFPASIEGAKEIQRTADGEGEAVCGQEHLHPVALRQHGGGSPDPVISP